MLVYFHGGRWVFGDLDSHDPLCRLVCRDAGVHFLSIDYRLAPEHPAPAGIDDAYAAYLWACAHAGELGASVGHVAVGGDSAGGNLAALVAQRAHADEAPAPALQWLLYPMTDVAARTRSTTLFADGFVLTEHDIDWFVGQYLGGSTLEPADPRVSPARAGNLSGLAPALIAVAGFDPLRDDGLQYGGALKAAGNAVDLRMIGSLTHGFANLIAVALDNSSHVAARIRDQLVA
jgi:acetyl esterase